MEADSSTRALFIAWINHLCVRYVRERRGRGGREKEEREKREREMGKLYTYIQPRAHN